MKDDPSTQESPQFSSEHTSNDLLFRLDPDGIRKALNYQIVAQSADEVQDVRNAPPFSIGPWLIESGQTELLTTISVYSERGANRDSAIEIPRS